ncbi:Uncharacterized protein RDABS01_002657 [Bienertia sinuspersici]
MASQALRLLVLILACFCLISSNAIPMPRLTNLPNKGKDFIIAAETMKQDQMISEDKIEEDFIEGRMDIEKNDYGPTTSNPIHTPRPPHT